MNSEREHVFMNMRTVFTANPAFERSIVPSADGGLSSLRGLLLGAGASARYGNGCRVRELLSAVLVSFFCPRELLLSL